MAPPLPQWLEDSCLSCDMRVERIPRERSLEWTFDGLRLRHVSGGYFSVVGATLLAGGERREELDQPLIDQPEIGVLGFLTRRAGGTLEVLVQAKPEPGNVGLVQAAPSVQATESNYRRRHRGKATPFLEYFLSPGKAALVSDSLQSEEGTRFLGKYNRNMVVEVGGGDAVPESDAYRWFPIDAITPLLARDFQVNTDARSVLASAPWSALVPDRTPFARFRGRGGTGEDVLRSFEAREDESALTTLRIAERLERHRAAPGLASATVGLTELTDWELNDTGLRNSRRGTFAIGQFSVETSGREVPRWDQPLVVSSGEGEAALLCQRRGGILHFLFDARPEIGFREIFQYGPTIRRLGDEPPILPGREKQAAALEGLLARSETLLSCRQSDEGGRFFRAVSRYRVAGILESEVVDLGDNLSWMTLRQVASLIARPGFFSNEARSLVSMLLSYL